MEDEAGDPGSALAIFAPVIEQISPMISVPFLTWIAWEMEGASAASRIAKQAIHAANRRVKLFIPIESF